MPGGEAQELWGTMDAARRGRVELGGAASGAASGARFFIRVGPGVGTHGKFLASLWGALRHKLPDCSWELSYSILELPDSSLDLSNLHLELYGLTRDGANCILESAYFVLEARDFAVEVMFLAK